ncbi:hypothetical protein B005_5583 [Nocardiopsis alba ATCC BAA-2165]|uniref:Uncharacterized protein n=1 Tax=Nocardiopsis alba (strain ATCC BAA-2165 / BE74) TaxID=1205910 RepID=J7L5U7_NOCAA|nr:hypothetical protein B005_5583 [Nocardiopsis alba ATCC BAA-2165]
MSGREEGGIPASGRVGVAGVAVHVPEWANVAIKVSSLMLKRPDERGFRVLWDENAVFPGRGPLRREVRRYPPNLDYVDTQS